MSIDKVDVVEALSEFLDDQTIEGLGFVLANATGNEQDGVMLLQTWPDGDEEPSVSFLLRVTRSRESEVRS